MPWAKKEKKMKTVTKRVALLLAFVIALFAVTSCMNGSDSEGNIRLVVAEEVPQVFDVELDGLDTSQGLVSILDKLSDDGVLEYSMTGTMITSVGALESQGNVYIYIYTSVERDFDVSQYAQTVEYDGQELTSAGVGAYDMHFEDGAVIYIGTIEW